MVSSADEMLDRAIWDKEDERKLSLDVEMDSWFQQNVKLPATLKDVRLLGSQEGLNKDFFAVLYMNKDEHWGERRSSIKRNELSEDTIMTRGLAIEGNFVLEFDNDIWMSIGQQDYSCIDVKLVSRGDIEDWDK